MARELIRRREIEVEELYALEGWIGENLPEQYLPANRIFAVTPAELAQLSALSTPNQVLVVARQPKVSFRAEDLASTMSLYLDNIQDPGNMGTILRVADWFGVSFLICSPGCVDIFNPKVVQASMGSVLRVRCLLDVPLERLCKEIPDLPVFGADMEGVSLFSASLPPACIIAIGNEGQGLSREVSALLSGRIAIPRGPGGGAESLNAGVAAGIICAFFQHRQA